MLYNLPMKRFACPLLFGVFLFGCAATILNNFPAFSQSLGVTMPTEYKRLFHSGETTIDSSLRYDVYQIEEEWSLEYSTQFYTEFKEEFDLLEYSDAINHYEPLKIPEKYYIPLSPSLDWVCKRAKSESRNTECLLIYDAQTKILYALDSIHQWVHRAIPERGKYKAW